MTWLPSSIGTALTASDTTWDLSMFGTSGRTTSIDILGIKLKENCFLANLYKSEQSVFISDAMKVIPEEMLRLSRTPRNFSYLLPFVEKVS